MRLIEYDGKNLLARHGLALLPRRLLAPTETAAWDGDGDGSDVVVKAQVLSGGRGKAGLIRKAGPDTLAQTVCDLRRLLHERGLPSWLMIEQGAAVVAEHYLAIVVDDIARTPCLLYSPRGGIEVEAHPDEVRRLPIDPLAGLVAHRVIRFLRDAGASPAWLGQLGRFALALWRVYCVEDAELIEINPLAVTADRRLLALDAKIVLDDHAAARHPERRDWVSAELAGGPPASGATDTYVEMPGNIGLLTGGAGLGMATLDMLADAGLAAATFVDGAGGGVAAVYENKARRVLNRSRDPAIEGVLIYFTLAAASLGPIVRGTLEALKACPLNKPIVVGIVAAAAAEAEMSAAEARQAFVDAGFPFCPELDEAVAELARRVKARR